MNSNGIAGVVSWYSKLDVLLNIATFMGDICSVPSSSIRVWLISFKAIVGFSTALCTLGDFSFDGLLSSVNAGDPAASVVAASGTVDEAAIAAAWRSDPSCA